MYDEENRDLYGKCNNPNGHGHNYKMEVTVCGPVDPLNGMVVNLDVLKCIIKDYVLDVLDHRNIDLDVEYFRDHNIVSSAENIAIFIFDQIKLHSITKFPPGVKLSSVKLYETDKNFVEIRCDE